MPTSHFDQLSEIVRLIILAKPKSILDIGVGFGKYGFLARKYLEIWGTIEYNDWKIRIDGIEAFQRYLTPVHKFIYNEIYIGNAIEILPTLKTDYDLILLIDVLEHLSYEQGRQLLRDCMAHAKNTIISTPKNMNAQHSDVNPYENHKFQWKKKLFAEFSNKFFVSHPRSLICYIGNDAHRLKKVVYKSRMTETIKTQFPFLAVPYRVFRRWFSRSISACHRTFADRKFPLT